MISFLSSLTNEQLQTRVKWMLKELKANKVIPDDIILDSRLFAVRSSKHVFDLLWKLVCHDIYFLWTRIDFLSNPDENVLIQVPFTVSQQKKFQIFFYLNFKSGYRRKELKKRSLILKYRN